MMSFAQEFGTISPFFVILNMVRENQAFRFTAEHSPTRRHWQRVIYDTFVPLHRSTRANTVKRGVVVLKQALEDLARD